MELTFLDARVWKYVISAIAKVVSETTMKINEEGVRIRTMDEAKVVLVDFFIPASDFETYEVEGEIEFGLNLDDLTKVMRRAQKDDTLSIEVGESSYSIIYKGRGIRKFTLPQLDVASESIPEPELEFDVKVELTSDAYRELVKDLEPIADTVTFVAEPSTLRVEATSDLGEAEVIIPQDSGVLLDYEVKSSGEPPKSSYGVEHLAYISTASQVAHKASLEFSNEMPLKVTFSIGEGGWLAYLVAPRLL
ncbi:DNA polymerase [Ignicoccus pacificus DSM 13166]|uniref:DNA polymerase sliding clamp n=1 Tax=Ignicoccus pacificus DSM 13166 TaxID=940294 RepID=A0A977K8X0_9CREN|nr:DNA polymerase [Ignicoccus pacificus DSM 13166]